MDESQARVFPGIRFLITGAALVVVIAGLKAAQALLVPFLFAFFLAVLGGTSVTWLKRKGVPSPIAVSGVTLGMLAIFTLIGVLLGNSVNEFTENIPKYQEQLTAATLSLEDWLAEQGVETKSSNLTDSLDPSNVMSLFGAALKGFVSTLSSTFMVIIVMIFMLIEAADFRLKIRTALSGSMDIDRMEGVASDVQRYLGMKTVTSLLTGLLVYAWVTIMDIDFPFLWGLVAFLLNYIPFIGSIIASIPAIMLSAVEHSVAATVGLGVGYMVINIGISNFFEPILMGRRLGLSPLVVFMSLVIWGWIWGPAGALMSVPLTMILKILLEHSDDSRWIAILMGPRPIVDEE